jgi:DNA primase
LNPEHDDSNPSFRIDKLSGVAHCFSCGFKTNIFKYFGVFNNPVPLKILQLKQKLNSISSYGLGLDLPNGHTPYTKPFRGISTKTLKHFGAFYTNQVEELQDRIVFPAYDVRDKLVAFIGRHILSSGNPRYKNYPSKVTLPLFPAKLPQEHKSLVLVEGIFDMLNLYDKGLQNVVACLGTNTLQNNTKEKLLPFKAQGVSKLYVLFDGDQAGRKAAQFIKPILEEQEFFVEVLDLPDDKDPGELDQSEVYQLINYIN